MVFEHDKAKKEGVERGLKSELFNTMSKADSATNAYAIRCIRYIILALMVFLLLQYLQIWGVEESIALHGCLGALAFLLVAQIIGYFTDHTARWLKYVLVLLTVVAVTIFGIYLTYHAVLTSVVPLLIAAQYSKKRVLVFAYILSIVSIFCIVIFGYQYGVSDANMLIQAAGKSSDYGNYLFSEISSFSERRTSLIVFFAIPRCLIITAFVPLINAIVVNRKEVIMRQVEIKYTGEHDTLTGLYNRAKYASMLKEAYIKLDNVVILYFDINNLKYVNDTFGHDMGDELIVRAADSIRSTISENMDAYRLGGDEFMVVIPNGDSRDADAFIENWKQNLKTINSLPSVAECKIACGYASGSGKVFCDILKIADKNMYDNKVKCKSHAPLHVEKHELEKNTAFERHSSDGE